MTGQGSKPVVGFYSDKQAIYMHLTLFFLIIIVELNQLDKSAARWTERVEPWNLKFQAQGKGHVKSFRKNLA